MYDLVEREDLYYEKLTDVPFTGKVTGYSQGSFKNGKREGVWISYHVNGQLWYKQNYKNGMLKGAFISYYKNGQLIAKGNHKNSKKEGPWVFYHKAGNVDKEYTGTYKDGVKISD